MGSSVWVTGPIWEMDALAVPPRLPLPPALLTPAACWLPRTPWPAGDRTGLRRAAGHARQRTAGFGALQLPLGQNRIVASHLDIDIVLERERDGILHRQIQLSGANQIAEALGVAQADGRHFRRQIRPPEDGRGGPDRLDRKLLRRSERNGPRAAQGHGDTFANVETKPQLCRVMASPPRAPGLEVC